ncbi:hypothetical protein H072_5516 [Dactylellina haptotyla CBS 200.50]|uniref:serine--tRNA ligase n=1 Tax=Dactylellina haptotyla (strain CBS 200.50) TaxID=1284197 RepID=S8BZ23_DACHA|nr:hypothetical protein H072_5516 [Dactylellina haptotyla CBS 200.50]
MTPHRLTDSLKLNGCLSSRHCPNIFIANRISRRVRPFVIPSSFFNSQASSSLAPKPIIATKPIRENPELYSQNCLNRSLSLEATYPARISKLSDDLFELRSTLNQTRSKQNTLAATIKAAASKRNDSFKELEILQAQARELKQRIAAAEAIEKHLEDEMNLLAVQLPNLSHPDTPIRGNPVVVRYINPEKLPRHSVDVYDAEIMFTGTPGISHVDIGNSLGILDFNSSNKTSGWGWYFLRGDGVLLEQALIQYALACARKEGWDLVSPPSVVYTHIAAACGFKPRDQNNEQQVYYISQHSVHTEAAKPDLCLTGTAEIPLAGMLANTSLSQTSFPIKMSGVSRCYRAEAGSHGLAAKGLYRVHEFTKVELFAWTTSDPIISDSIFRGMLDLQIEILTNLGIPARVINMPTDDLGAPAYRKYDIEAFIPSRQGTKYGGWGEVTSSSECTDYQARRLNARYKHPDGKMGFLWSLNGTALAIPRIIVAILENNWDEAERVVHLPSILHKYMDGVKVLKPQSC